MKSNIMSAIATMTAIAGVNGLENLLGTPSRPAKVFFKATPEMIEARLTLAEEKRLRKLNRNQGKK